MPLLVVAASVLVAIAILLIFLGVGNRIQTEGELRTRLDVLPPLSGSSTETEARERRLHPLMEAINRIISGRAFAASIATDLARANLPLTASEYVLLCIACGIGLGIAVLVATGQLLLAPIGAVLGTMLPRAYIRHRQGRRLLAFQEQLPDVLTLLVGSLRSGYGITIAMDTVAKQMPAPACEEFSRVVREIGLGLPTTQALGNLVRRVRSDDLDLVVTAIAIQYEVGGNLATILETISETIRDRIRLKGQLRVLTAQQSLQRVILTALPLVLGVIVYIMNPLYMKQLFTPGITLIIPIGTGLLAVLGYFVMGKLSRVEF